MPLQGASLRACGVLDRACLVGEAQGVATPPLLTNGPPTVTVNLPAGFVGFLRLTAPDYVDYDYYIGGPMTKNAISTQPFTMVSTSSFVEFVQGLGANPQTAGGLGSLGVQILNCMEDPASGVQLRLSDPDRPELQGAEVWAAQGYLPVPGTLTDNTGVAGLINLPSVNLAVEAVIAGRTFGGRSFPIQAGRLTTGTIRPYYTNGL
jgi:hypothetical protein